MQEIVPSIDSLIQKLTAPLAQQLGFDVSESEDTSKRELRTTIIGAALSAKEPK